jgi:hypothetical protein
VRHTAWNECQFAGRSRQQLVLHLERQLAVEDVERLVEVVHVQGRAGKVGAGVDLDDRALSVGLLAS